MSAVIELIFQTLWEWATISVYERYGWPAAVAVALSPFIVIGLLIWMLVVWLG